MLEKGTSGVKDMLEKGATKDMIERGKSMIENSKDLAGKNPVGDAMKGLFGN